jgi:solute carrier family 25 protein 44
MKNAPLNIPQTGAHSQARAIEAIRAVYLTHGLRGFYRGYFASIAVYAPNSATWWFSYQTYYGE